MKATLRNIAKNLKKSSKVHAKQSKQLENIMKNSPTRQNGKVIGKLEIKRKGPVKPKFPMDPRGRNNIDPEILIKNMPYRPGKDSKEVKELLEIIKKQGKDKSARGGAAGGGMTEKGVREYKRKNPGSKLKTAVTGKNPSKKDAARRKSFCARSRSWKSERGLAARRRWRC